ncbi:hypothetical protein [Ulvibacter antarcticus]|uniref:Lysylphosphatidylglycerol synthase-like protein n=1 Tax=Ulvibacter antarcticus TaxID=442714 RepID=A0A3L9ZI63_9FLAO|nr:hypothetical protein [Ulvibacter antarcticus]RMA66402.1 hypothetical protein BXY75_0826 [Ulvibacter antarcticus]
MIPSRHKSKQYLLSALKVLIVAVTFGYIYVKLTSDSALSIPDFLVILKSKAISPIYFVIIIALAVSNWLFEILKWQTIVSTLQPISFVEAVKQSLASLTASLATPNRIGEYGAKAMFYSKDKRKKILVLNLVTNGTQMLVTTFFGVVGINYIIETYKLNFSPLKISMLLLILLIIGFLAYFYKEKELLVKGLSVSNLKKYIKKIPFSVKFKVLLYSLVRYILFSTLFLLLLYLFSGESRPSSDIYLVFSMYLLVSIIPTIFVFDVIVKGGVAVWLFSMAGYPELTVLCTVLTMWLLNFVIPAIWGSFYVLRFKPATV